MSLLKRRQWYYLLACITTFSFVKMFIMTIISNEQTHELERSAIHHVINYQMYQQNVTKPIPDVFNFSSFTYINHRIRNAIWESSHICTNEVKPTEVHYSNKWQMYKNKTELYVYSAYYDDRPSVGITPVIRIQAVSSHAPDTLYCQVWYKDFTQPLITKTAKLRSGRGDIFNKVKYGQEQYFCDLPVSLPIPTHVSIATAPCERSTILLPVNMDIRSDWEIEFGVCVAIAFGDISVKYFVEWMELNQIFGVQEFNIYDGNISSRMNSVFQHYIDKGTLRLVSMPPPVSDFSKKGVKLSSPASLNDCMLRNMYRYRYLVVIDFDEFIVPYLHNNYSQMLTAIDTDKRLSESWISYTFRNVYYFSHFSIDNSQPAYLKTMQFRTRVKNPSKFLYAPKSFINPRTCLSLFNHYCLIRIPPDIRQWTIDVNSTIATSHHYRTCGFDKKKCEDLSKDTIQDDTMLKYKPELDNRVHHVLTKLGIL